MSVSAVVEVWPTCARAESTVSATGGGELHGLNRLSVCDATCNLTSFLMLRNTLLLLVHNNY